MEPGKKRMNIVIDDELHRLLKIEVAKVQRLQNSWQKQLKKKSNVATRSNSEWKITKK